MTNEELIDALAGLTPFNEEDQAVLDAADIFGLEGC